MSTNGGGAPPASALARLGHTEIIGPVPNAPEDEVFFRALRTSRLFSEVESADLEQQFRADRALDLFGLLVGSGKLTQYQFQRLRRGEPIGLVIGPYHVLDELGRGGGGQVYMARHIVLGRSAALKVVDPRYTEGRALIELFRREVAAITRLDHPNVVRVYDANDVDGVLYLAMEFVDGPTLHRYTLEQGPLPPALGVRALMQTAQALQHAHEHGLVHRDIKPANIMFPGAVCAAVEAEGRPLVKVVDFGLARLRDHGEGGMSTIQCPDGAAMGTPAFMAPEQIRNVHGVDIRSDLYSLGCTFYFALAGRLPFEAPTTRLALVMHLEQEPPPLRSVSPSVPVALARIVHRLMAKNPADRYQTPADLVAALNEFVLSGGLADAGTTAPLPRSVPDEPPAPRAPVPAPTCSAEPCASRTRPDPTAVAEFRRLWVRWCAVVESRACGEPPPVSVEGYKALYRALMEATRSARGSVSELADEQFDRLENAVEPWVTLQALATLDRHALLDLWGTCQKFDARLTPAPAPRNQWPGALALILLAVALALGWWVSAYRPDLTVGVTEMARAQPQLLSIPLVVALLVVLLFRSREPRDHPTAPRAR